MANDILTPAQALGIPEQPQQIPHPPYDDVDVGLGDLNFDWADIPLSGFLDLDPRSVLSMFVYGLLLLAKDMSKFSHAARHV